MDARILIMHGGCRRAGREHSAAVTQRTSCSSTRAFLSEVKASFLRCTVCGFTGCRRALREALCAGASASAGPLRNLLPSPQVRSSLFELAKKTKFNLCRHTVVTFTLLVILNLLVIFIPSMKDIFGVIGTAF